MSYLKYLILFAFCLLLVNSDELKNETLPDGNTKEDVSEISATIAPAPASTDTPTTITTEPPTTLPTTPTTITTTPSSTTSTTSTETPATTKPTSPVPSSSTTAKPAPHEDHFSWSSFFGGIVTAIGLSAIGYIGFRFYKARRDHQFHSLL